MEIYCVKEVEQNPVPKSQTKPFYIGTKEAPSGAKRKKIYVDENILGPEGCLPLPRGYIHVYDHNIQTSSLKPLGQSKPNFLWSILRKSE